MKFKDLQTGDYSSHTTIEGLYSMICEGYCECGHGNDVIDSKDGTMKCLNCFRLNNLEKTTQQEMINIIQEDGYIIEDLEEMEIITKQDYADLMEKKTFKKEERTEYDEIKYNYCPSYWELEDYTEDKDMCEDTCEICFQCWETKLTESELKEYIKLKGEVK